MVLHNGITSFLWALAISAAIFIPGLAIYYAFFHFHSNKAIKEYLRKNHLNKSGIIKRGHITLYAGYLDKINPKEGRSGVLFMTKEKLVFIGLRRKEPLLELDRDKIDKVQPGILGPFRKFEDSGPEKELIQIISGEHLYCINGRLLDSWLNLLGKK